ncbi:MAG: hypothetical protein H9W81_12825 [Enterococcus sp.]|nr:hypothetical protein [Enterococcus sp.]
MDNNANIFYDSEIEEIVQKRSLELLPIVEYLLTEYPKASPGDILYTVRDHVSKHGFEGVPPYIMEEPKPEPEFVPEPEPVVVAEEPEEEGAVVKARRIKRRQAEAPRQNVNVRGIMEDVADLNL